MTIRTSDFFRGLSGYSGYSGSGGGGSSEITINQDDHGFSVLNVVKSSGVDGTYALAQANTSANADVVGIISEIIDANNFKLLTSGELISTSVPNYAAGTVVYLSESTPGILTDTEPSSINNVSKPLGVVTTAANSMIFVNWRGFLISDDPVVERNATWVIENPTATGIPGPRMKWNGECVRLDSFVVGSGSTVDFNIEKRSSPNTAGTNILTSDLQSTTSGVSTTTFSSSSITADEWLWVDISSVSGTVTSMSISLSIAVG